MSKIEKPVKEDYCYGNGHDQCGCGACEAIEQSDKYWEQEIVNKDEEIKRLADRDCNATIRLSYEKGGYPWHTEDLKVVDVGVSDNIYMVESKVLEDTQNGLKALKQKLSIENIEKVIGNYFRQYLDNLLSESDIDIIKEELAKAIHKLTKE